MTIENTENLNNDSAPTASTLTPSDETIGEPAYVRPVPESIESRALAKAQKDVEARHRGMAIIESKQENSGVLNEEKAASSVAVEPNSAPGAMPVAESAPVVPDFLQGEEREAFSQWPESAQVVLVREVAKHQAIVRQAESLAQAHAREINEYQRLQHAFQQDPAGLLEALAQQAGVSLGAQNEPPTFDSPAELAQWAADKAVRDVEAKNARALQEAQAAQARQHAEQAFLAELKEAAIALPNFDQHKPSVLQILGAVPTLSVKHAYQLASFEQLAEQAQAIPMLKADLAKAQAEIQSLKANKARPDERINVQERRNNQNIDPAQAAFERAQRKVNNRHAQTN